jgi:hypothetical protein
MAARSGIWPIVNWLRVSGYLPDAMNNSRIKAEFYQAGACYPSQTRIVPDWLPANRAALLWRR